MTNNKKNLLVKAAACLIAMMTVVACGNDKKTTTPTDGPAKVDPNANKGTGDVAAPIDPATTGNKLTFQNLDTAKDVKHLAVTENGDVYAANASSLFFGSKGAALTSVSLEATGLDNTPGKADLKGKGPIKSLQAFGDGVYITLEKGAVGHLKNGAFDAGWDNSKAGQHVAFAGIASPSDKYDAPLSFAGALVKDKVEHTFLMKDNYKYIANGPITGALTNWLQSKTGVAATVPGNIVTTYFTSANVKIVPTLDGALVIDPGYEIRFLSAADVGSAKAGTEKLGAPASAWKYNEGSWKGVLPGNRFFSVNNDKLSAALFLNNKLYVGLATRDEEGASKARFSGGVVVYDYKYENDKATLTRVDLDDRWAGHSVINLFELNGKVHAATKATKVENGETSVDYSVISVNEDGTLGTQLDIPAGTVINAAAAIETKKLVIANNNGVLVQQ